MASYEAVRIVEIVKGEKKHLKYQLKFDEFEKIFDAVRNVPVAIISIAGAYRSGKSFLMTLLADYLLKDPSEEWGSVKQKKLTKVFEHRGGIDGHTNGIYVTRKPFMMKTKDEKEIAVFLMDTQGMFDKKSSANDNSVIFALSTLLSSVQIYNIDKLIREDDLHNLKLFTDYAHCVSNKQRNVSTSPRNVAVNHPFQGLFFLCRNWEQPKQYSNGFDGGSKYLSSVMEADSEENNLVRQRMTDSFSCISCSLIPHPGKSITQRGPIDSEALCFSDMDKDFIYEVDALAKHLFGKEQLVAKKLNGRELTGEAIIYLAREYIRILHSGEIPKIEILVQSNERVEFHLRVKEIESNYKTSMQTQMGEMPLVPGEFKALHLQCLCEAKDLFYKINIFEDEAEREKYLEKMESNIVRICQSVSKDNKAKITRVMMMSDDHTMTAGRVYYESLEEFAANCWVEDLLKAKDRATKNANAWFQACMNDIEKQWFDENKRKALQSTFDSKQKQFENKNTLRKGELDKHMSQLHLDAIRKYRELMEQAVHQRSQDMQMEHDKNLSCALALFHDSNIGKNTKYRNAKELELKLKLSEEFKRYQKLYKKTTDDMRNVVEQAKQRYLQNIHPMNQYVVETELESSHVNAVNMAKEVLNAVSDHGEGFVQKCKEKFDEVMKAEKQNWISRNKTLKKIITEKLLPFHEQLQVDYLENLIEFTRTRYAKIENLDKMHKKFKDAVKREVEPLIPFADIFKETIQLSFKNLDAKFKVVQMGNTRWNAFKGTTSDFIEAGTTFGVIVLGVPGGLVAGSAAGVVGAAAGLINLARSVNGEIDVSELKSIRILKDLKLVAN